MTARRKRPPAQVRADPGAGDLFGGGLSPDERRRTETLRAAYWHIFRCHQRIAEGQALSAEASAAALLAVQTAERALLPDEANRVYWATAEAWVRQTGLSPVTGRPDPWAPPPDGGSAA